MPGLFLLVWLALHQGVPLRDAYRLSLPPEPPCPRVLLAGGHGPPRLVARFLPYRSWEREYRDYFRLHYHDPSLKLHPTMIVMHYTVGSTAEGVLAGFEHGANMWDGDAGTVFGHPSVQLMVDTDGTILQLLPLDRKATGTYGVDHVAISIEQVAVSERDLLSRPRQVQASFRLVAWLCQRFQIPPSRVYGHYEISIGKLYVDDYTDDSDSRWPWCYPLPSARYDPGARYMTWLREYLSHARIGANVEKQRVRNPGKVGARARPPVVRQP